MEEVGNLQSYRKSVRLIDATLRDGGIVNNFAFSDTFVSDLYIANQQAGVDVMEFGYKASDKLFDREKYGKWKFCDEENISAIVGKNKGDMAIAVMADVGRIDFDRQVVPKKDSAIDIYRVATYSNRMPAAVEMIEHLDRLGYRTTCNIMAVSKMRESELKHSVEIAAQSPAECIYIVDSFGAIYPEEMRKICDIYLDICARYGKQVGIHAHNNQQLAFANTIEACAKGVNWLDGAVNGMGRGAGNCFTEQLLGFLKNPKYRLEPIFGFIREHMIAMRGEQKWGYDVPYLITGLYNAHPCAAIDFIKADRHDYERFVQEVLGID
jgi:4-hydroxy 2-oxovalerate aldolase